MEQRIEEFLEKLNTLRCKGWQIWYDHKGSVRLKKRGNDTTYLFYDPLTAVCLEYYGNDFNYCNLKHVSEAGDLLGLTESETARITFAADKGATFDDRGARFCPGWGYSKPLRLRIEESLGSKPVSTPRRLCAVLAPSSYIVERWPPMG